MYLNRDQLREDDTLSLRLFTDDIELLFRKLKLVFFTTLS